MAINSVSGVNNSSYTTSATSTASTSAKDKATTAAAETAKENVSADGDKLEKSAEYKIDQKKLDELWQMHSSKVDAFEKMVNTLFEKQGIKYNNAQGLKANLEELIASGGVSEEERLAAEQEISEDGYWGVEKTSERILDFAKAISGGDPSKIDALRSAVESGFSGAGKAWGDKLPDICQKTYDRVMQGFDDWANEGKTETEA